ncbi:hypothetical protein ABTN11_20310, partial [Acinetobacter baumannii]
DLDTPVSAYLKLGNRPYSFLFESMLGGERWGRYSFIGLPCREMVQVHGRRITRHLDGQIVEQAEAANPLPWIQAYADRFEVREAPGLPR